MKMHPLIAVGAAMAWLAQGRHLAGQGDYVLAFLHYGFAAYVYVLVFTALWREGAELWRTRPWR